MGRCEELPMVAAAADTAACMLGARPAGLPWMAEVDALLPLATPYP